jgi:hypothetical protein
MPRHDIFHPTDELRRYIVIRQERDMVSKIGQSLEALRLPDCEIRVLLNVEVEGKPRLAIKRGGY